MGDYDGSRISFDCWNLGKAIIKEDPNCSSDFTNPVPGEWLYMDNHTGCYVGDGLDDLPERFMTTQLGTRDGDTFTFHVRTAGHINEHGCYTTHIYAVDYVSSVIRGAVDTTDRPAAALLSADWVDVGQLKKLMTKM